MGVNLIRCLNTHKHMHVYACTHARTNTLMHACTHAHIHTRTHARTHARKCTLMHSNPHLKISPKSSLSLASQHRHVSPLAGLQVQRVSRCHCCISQGKYGNYASIACPVHWLKMVCRWTSSTNIKFYNLSWYLLPVSKSLQLPSSCMTPYILVLIFTGILGEPRSSA